MPSLPLIKSLGFFLMLLGTAFSNSVCGIGLGIYAGALLLGSLTERSFDWRIFPAKQTLIPLVISLVVSTLISRYFIVSVNGLGKYLQGFLILYAAMDIFRCPAKQKVAWLVLASAILLAVLGGFSQEWLGADLLRGHKALKHLDDFNVVRLTGSFKHPNDYGSFLIMGFPFALAGFVMALKMQKRSAAGFWLVLFLSLTYLMIRTMSRGAILSTFAAVFIFGFAFKFRWKVVALLAIGLALIWFIPSPMQVRFQEMLHFRGSSPERLVLIETSLRMIKSSPLFGLGLNTYSDYFPLFRPPDYKAYMYAHNSYLQIATEAGLLGLFLYLLFISTLIRRTTCAFFLNRSSDQTRMFGFALIAGICGLLVNCLFESSLQSTQLRTLFWALLGIACAMATYATTPQKNK